MTAGTTSAQGHSTDSFTAEELEEAKRYLIKRMTEFWEDSSIGFKLRDNAISTFKKSHKLKDASIEEVKIQADLENENDVSYAIDMNSDVMSQHEE